MPFRTILTLAAMLFLTGAMLASASAQTPGASLVAGYWAVTDVREIAVEGEPLALSPDGRWIAGVGPNNLGLCVWEVVSLTPTCDGSDLDPDPYTFVWAPDSSAVVFADGETITRDPEPDTLWRYSLADGSLAALSSGRVHRGMAWSQDSERVLFLTVTSDGRRANLMYVGRDGGDVVRMHVPQLVYLGPLQTRDDGSVLFTSVNERGALSVWRADMHGDAIVKIADIDAPEPAAPSQMVEIDKDQRRALMWRADLSTGPMLSTWYVVDLETGETVTIELAASVDAIAGMGMLPDGVTGIALAHNEGDAEVHLFLVDLRTGESSPVVGEGIELPGSLWRASATSDGRQRLLVGDNGATLVTLAPAT